MVVKNYINFSNLTIFSFFKLIFQVKRCKSFELRAGNLYTVCGCTKKNGLQHDCPRSECQGRPCCLCKPEPTCCPSKFHKRFANKTMGKKTNPCCPPRMCCPGPCNPCSKSCDPCCDPCNRIPCCDPCSYQCKFSSFLFLCIILIFVILYGFQVLHTTVIDVNLNILQSSLKNLV